MSPPSREEERQRASVEAARIERTHRRLLHLYEISKLLTRFESAERTVPQVLSVLNEALPLCTAILLLERTDPRASPHVITWQQAGVSASQLRAAKASAKAGYGYLVRSADEQRQEEPQSELELEAAPARGAMSALPSRPEERFPERGSQSVLLPLVGNRGRSFGVMQLQGERPLDEEDLGFVNAVVNQLAIGLDRLALIEAAQAKTEAGRQAEQEAKLEAREQLDFIRAVTGSLGEGVLAVDHKERLTFLNPSAMQMLGWASREAMGASFSELFQIRRVEGTELPPAEHPLRRVIRSGKSLRDEEQLFGGRDAQFFPVSYTASPLRREGQVVGAVLVFQNILELQRTEHLQRFLSETGALLASSLDSRQTLASIVRASVPLLSDVCLIDELREDGVVERVHVAGASPQQEGFAERLRGLVPTLAGDTPQARALRTGESVLIAEPPPERLTPPQASDASGADAESVMVAPLSARGRTLGAITFVSSGSGRRFTERDLSFAEEVARRAAMAMDNARLYEQAQHAVRLRDEMLGVVSHDLRNQLGAVLMNASLLRSEPLVKEHGTRTRKGIESIERSARQMSRLISDLLDVGSIETGHLSLVTMPVSVKELLQEVEEQHQAVAASKGLRFECLLRETGEAFPEVLGDRGRLLQVFGNLVGNALKFTRVGSITVDAEPRDEYVLFSVTDTGPGIAAPSLAHVFDRYWQAKKTAHLGTGVGLSIAQGIVLGHGGRIWAESQEGAGTTFFFLIPAALCSSP